MSSEPHSEFTSEGHKRKLDELEIAKQKAQEIAARLTSDAESKRSRLDSQCSSPPSNSFPTPYFDNAQKFQSQAAANPQGPKKISIPNSKVGVIIGKGGETIKLLQLQSGARIQITKDAEVVDPRAPTRDVELVGTPEQVSKAEQLIADVIEEADAGGSAASAVHGIKSTQPGAEQIVLKVPNTKVALLIGKGGETIKTIQGRSGARMQIVPLRLPPGDTSTERSVYINGSKEQIDSAQEMVNEIVNEGRLRNPPGPSTYMQQPAYNTPSTWAPPTQPPGQQHGGYGYAAPASYPPSGSYYGNYQGTQQASWDQSNPAAVQQQNAGYNYYGQQDQTGSAPPTYNYGYSQTPISSQGYSQGYSQQPPSYGQTVPGQAPALDQQNPYATTPGYGSTTNPSSQPYGATPPAQPTQTLPSNPVGYSQPMGAPQAGYGSWQGYTAPQSGYDQTASAQAGYGAQQPVQAPPLATLPPYGQSAYPTQAAPPSSNYPQGTNPPAYGQPQFHPPTHSQPPARGAPQSLATGGESNGDGNSAPVYGSPATQESAHS